MNTIQEALLVQWLEFTVPNGEARVRFLDSALSRTLYTNYTLSFGFCTNRAVNCEIT